MGLKVFIIAAAALAIPFPVLCQWNADPAVNTPVCLAPAKQIDQRILEDGKGGAFITWKDYRQAAVPDIYLQRLNAQGVPLWTTDGLGVCTHPADQSTPWITSDLSGGAIVAWSDWRSGVERDIYAQRIDSNGILLWTPDGAIVTDKPNREHNEKIVPDGTGGAIVVWEQQSFPNWDVWAQRLDAFGNRKWGNGGIPLTTVPGNRINARLQEDGKGGAYFVWQDFRNGLDYNIYGQHLDSSGNLLWGNAGLAICNAVNPQIDPKVVSCYAGTRGIYVCWIDKRTGFDYDLYAQRVDSNGNLLWTANGVAVTAATGNQTAQDILSGEDVDGLIATWKDNRSGTYDIYAQRIDPAGNIQMTINGTPVSTSGFTKLNPDITGDGVGGALIAWQDSAPGTSWNVSVQRIAGNGIALWTLNGTDAGIAQDDQTSPKICSDGNKGCIVAFQDKRSGTFDIYAHHLNGKGFPLVRGNLNASPARITAFPNPFRDRFRVDPLPQGSNFILCGMRGETLSSGQDPSGEDFQWLCPGVYFLKIISPGCEPVVIRLLKD